MFVLDDYLQMAIFMDVQLEDDDGETSCCQGHDSVRLVTAS
jgi:hypothetical protein